ASEHLQTLKQFLVTMQRSSTRSDERSTATHYDSDDRSLRRHGFGLRIREVDGKHLQTLSGAGLAPEDPLSKGEWEEAIAGAEPDPAAPMTGPRLSAVIAADLLRPLFTTAFQRTVVEIERDSGGRIEAVIAEGEIRDAASDAAAPIGEIALRGADPATLYDLALRLLDLAPLRVETYGLAER